MLHLILGPSGSGKTYIMREKIASLVRAGEKNIALIVPEQNNFESERAMLRLLGSAPTDVVEVTSFSSLAKKLDSICGHDAREQADDAVKMLVMGRAVRAVKSELNVYGRVCETPEFCTEMLEQISEFKRSDIISEQLVAAANSTDSSALRNKAADIALIAGTYQALLGNRFSDPLDDLSRLCEALVSSDYFESRTVFIDAFKGFTRQQYNIIERILAQAAEVYITFCCDSLDDRDRGIGLFSNVKAAANRIIAMAKKNGVSVAAPEVVFGQKRFVTEGMAGVEELLRTGESECSDGSSVSVCACNTVYDEADFAARTIRRLVRTEGCRYRDFAVIVRDISAYQPAITAAFGHYNVPCFNDRRAEADSLALMRFAVNAVSAAAGAYSNDYMLPLIKSAVGELNVEQASELENYVLMWNKRGSRWLEEWTQNPNGLDPDFDSEALERINLYRRTVTEPLEKLRLSLASGSAKTICGALYRLLVDTHVDRRLAEYADRLDADGEYYFASLHRQSWDKLMSCLDSVVRAFGDDNCGKDEFVSLFGAVISSCDLGAIPDRLDEVVVGSADRIRAGAPKTVFVLGANYTEFPCSKRPSGLFSTADRRRLISGGLEMTDYSKENAVDEQFIAYTALTSASERLVITYHTSSVTGEKGTQSEFVRLITERLNGVRSLTSDSTREDRFEGVIPSLELVSDPEYRKYAPSLRDSLAERSVSAASAVSAMLDGRGEMKLTRKAAAKLFGTDISLSPSKLEAYGTCPFSFFCKYGLKAQPVNTAEYDVRNKGTLIHYVLEHIISEYGAGIVELDENARLAEIKCLIDEYVEQVFGNADEFDGSLSFLLERTAVQLNAVVARLCEEFMQSDFKPDRCELEIGGGEVAAVKIPLEGGSVVLKGKVDRVDIFEADGKTFVRVVDYKSGSKKFDVSDLFYGLNMQMLIYLFTVVKSGLYENAESAGVLYLPSKRSVKTCARSAADKASSDQSDELRMNGLLVDDALSLKAMEHDEAGRFIPYFPHGRKESSVASTDDFARIEKLVFGALSNVGRSILEGNVNIDPLDSATAAQGGACRYCDYSAVCLHDCRNNRNVEKMNLAQSLEKLEREEG